MKKYTSVLFVIVIAIIIGIFIINKKSTSDTMKIGVILPITGKTASIGETSNRLMEMARNDLKKAYPNSNVEIIVEDGAGDAKTSVVAAHKLLDVDKVNALYVAFTNPTLATLPLAKAKNVVFGHSTFTDTPLQSYEYALKTFIDYRDLCSKQGQIFTAKGYTKVVSVSEGSGLAEICAESLAKTFKGEVKISNFNGDTDVKTEMLKLKENNYQAIITTAYEPTMVKVIKANSEISYKPDIICNIATCGTTNIIKLFTTEQLSNVILNSTGVKKEFSDRYLEIYGSLPSAGLTSPVFDYEMVIDLAEGLISCGSNDPACVVAKAQTSKAEKGGLTNYVWKDRSMIPEVEYYNLIDGKLKLL